MTANMIMTYVFMIMTYVFLGAGLLGACLFVIGYLSDKLWMRCLGVVCMLESGAYLIIAII